MNKVIVAMLCIIVILGAVFTAMVIFEGNKSETPQLEEAKIDNENIIDDCTEEYEQLEKAKLLEANSKEEKTSPNCAFIFKVLYNGCGHITVQYSNIPENMVNKTQQDLKNEYGQYDIERFASNEVTFVKTLEGECGEHFLVKEREGKVTIYKIDEDEKESLYEQTEISTDYLTDTDKINIEKGIRIYGKQELNQLIEDFE